MVSGRSRTESYRLTGLLERGVCGGDLAGEAGIGDDEIAVDAARLATGMLVQVREDERGDGLTGHALARGSSHRLLDQRGDIEALVGRPADEDRVAAEAPVCLGDPCDLFGALDPRRDCWPAGGVVEKSGSVSVR